MKKFLRNLALVCATLFAYQTANSQTVSVTADLKTMFGGAAATKTQVCLSLVDGNGNQLSNPRTSGGVIVPTATQCVLPDGSGHVATTAIANDQITPSGSVYSVTYLYNGRSVHGDIYQFLLADGTENLNTKLGLSAIPVIPAPTGDTTYARLDGANQPFTNPIQAPTINAVTGFKINGAAIAGRYLKGDGTSFVQSSGSASGTGSPTSCTNQFVTGFTLNSDAAPTSTCTTVPYSAVSGTPAVPTGTGFSHTTAGVLDSASKLVNLTAATDVAANQGTTTTVFHGNAAGQGSFGAVVLTSDVSGILPTTNGGTGQNSSATFPTSGTILNDNNTVTVTNKRNTPRIVTMADATSVTPTSDTADQNIFSSTQAGGTLTVNAPSGTPTDGQKLILRLKSTNAQTYSFNATYAFSTSVTAPTTLAAGKTDYIGLIWNATNTKWDVVAVDQGH